MSTKIGTQRRTVENWVRKGLLPAYQFEDNGTFYVRHSDVMQMARSNPPGVIRMRRPLDLGPMARVVRVAKPIEAEPVA